MNGLASSILNGIHRIQDIVGSTSQGTRAGIAATLNAPRTITNQQDRKSVEKCYRAMDTVFHLCRQSGLNLKKSPPCILDVLPEIYALLDTILQAETDVLQHNVYAQLFLQNLYAKCKQTVRLFREERAKIFDESSKARRNLTMKALVLSHMAAELHAEFPSDGHFIGEKFRITKKEAADFWASAFQNRTIVSWEEFREQFTKVHPVNVGMETHALKSTIDLTCNDHISNFEFDVFTRLFQPWPTLLRNWQVLAVTHPAYVAFLTYEEVKLKLQKFINKPGSYVFRQSCTKLGQWAIGYVAPDHKIYQTIPQNKSLIQSLVEGSREGFYIYPHGRNKNVDLSHALSAHPPQDRMKVTSEQYQIYCAMGTTFEMCKICDERNKNVKLEPCGHLLCRPCLRSWAEESTESVSTCPFCRCEIKGTENIVIDSYHPSISTPISPTSSMIRSLSTKRFIISQQTFDTSEKINSDMPKIPSRNAPPPLPPKRIASPQLPAPLPAAIRNDNESQEDIGSTVNGNSDIRRSSLANGGQESPNSADPFASIPNPFVQPQYPESLSHGVCDLADALPRFKDFMEMEFTPQNL